MSRILVRQDSGAWNEPALSGYALESDLQEILSEHPELIPGVSDSALVCREFQSDVGPADIVVVDGGGEITLVECKLAANPQVRREIIGQLFDYAARLWRMDIGIFIQKWVDRTGVQPFPPDDVGELLRTEVSNNLREGAFRLVLAVDEINEPLKRMVEYLNARSTTGVSVVAVSYSRYQYGGIQVLMPELYGEELAESKGAVASRTLWSGDVYREWLERNRPESVQIFDGLVAEAETFGWSIVGSQAVVPSAAIPVKSAGGQTVARIWLFHYKLQGVSLEFNFGPMLELDEGQRPASNALCSFLDDFGSISGLRDVADNLRATDFRSRGPNVPLSSLGEDEIRRALRNIADLVESMPSGGV